MSLTAYSLPIPDHNNFSICIEAFILANAWDLFSVLFWWRMGSLLARVVVCRNTEQNLRLCLSRCFDLLKPNNPYLKLTEGPGSARGKAIDRRGDIYQVTCLMGRITGKDVCT